MSKKVSVFFPNYQLRDQERYAPDKIFTFRDREGNPFSTKVPMLGMTETQKVVLGWLWRHKAPPVISISHEKPTASDRSPFTDLNELYRQYCPYAVAVATVQCLGEARPRFLRVYFCNVELHEGATHCRDKGTYVVAIS